MVLEGLHGCYPSGRRGQKGKEKPPQASRKGLCNSNKVSQLFCEILIWKTSIVNLQSHFSSICIWINLMLKSSAEDEWGICVNVCSYLKISTKNLGSLCTPTFAIPLSAALRPFHKVLLSTYKKSMYCCCVCALVFLLCLRGNSCFFANPSAQCLIVQFSSLFFSGLRWPNTLEIHFIIIAKTV